jgi:hypothetical protein
MTASTETTAGPELNGQAPGPDDSTGQAPATASERVMGVIGIAFAVGLLLIGLDLATGGAVSRLFGARDDDSAGG